MAGPVETYPNLGQSFTSSEISVCLNSVIWNFLSDGHSIAPVYFILVYDKSQYWNQSLESTLLRELATAGPENDQSARS